MLGIVLSDGGFEDFVSDRGDDTFVVVLTDVGQDDRQVLGDWAVEKTHADVDSLHVVGTSCRVDHCGLGPDLKPDDSVNEGNLEVHALTVDMGLKTFESAHPDCTLSAVNHKDKVVCKDAKTNHGASNLAHTIENSFH